MECEDEMNDLKEMYEEQIKQYQQSLDEVMHPLCHYLKGLLDAYTKKQYIEEKLLVLNHKIKMQNEW